MEIKILNETLEGMPEFCRVEIDHKISIKKKEDVEKLKEKENGRKNK